MKEIEQIRKATDLVDIAGDYTKLKKRGNKMVGLCPFHSEKTPSFTVDAEKQLFHCFGCGQGGDVFTFVMEKLNLSFPEALKWLSEKCDLGNIRFEWLTSNVRDFQKELKDCFSKWLSDVMKDKQFIFKMSNLIKIGPLDEEAEIPF